MSGAYRVAKRRQGALSERAARQLGDMNVCVLCEAPAPRAPVATLPLSPLCHCHAAQKVAQTFLSARVKKMTGAFLRAQTAQTRMSAPPSLR